MCLPGTDAIMAYSFPASINASPMHATSASNSITLRLRLQKISGTLARAMANISEAGGDVGAIDIVRVEPDAVIRDVTVNTGGPDHSESIIAALNTETGIEVIHTSDRTFLMHLGGKIEVHSKTPIETRDQLSMAYTPGVARVCRAIHRYPEKAHAFTIKRNTVAVVSDGTAVLGLGDIGPEAAMPVMEGKAQLFKAFGGVDAFPICLATKDTEEIINTVKYISPGFGGINLEDIAAPRCFEIERRLKEELDIPVFHDDQHGTAVVVLAGMINALRVVNKKPEDLKVVFVGTGAAGIACTKILLQYGVQNIIGFDSRGAISRDRTDMNTAKQAYAEYTNPNNEKGSLHEVIAGADAFIGLSAPNVLTVPDLKRMTRDPIVFAMANPDPEIRPELAYPHVAVMATGRSDYPNQLNNVLCFPGIFKGALACRATDINEEMKLAAALAIAETIDADSVLPGYIIPSVFDRAVADRVAEAVKRAAVATGAARKGT